MKYIFYAIIALLSTNHLTAGFMDPWYQIAQEKRGREEGAENIYAGETLWGFNDTLQLMHKLDPSRYDFGPIHQTASIHYEHSNHLAEKEKVCHTGGENNPDQPAHIPTRYIQEEWREDENGSFIKDQYGNWSRKQLTKVPLRIGSAKEQYSGHDNTVDDRPHKELIYQNVTDRKNLLVRIQREYKPEEIDFINEYIGRRRVDIFSPTLLELALRTGFVREDSKNSRCYNLNGERYSRAPKKDELTLYSETNDYKIGKSFALQVLGEAQKRSPRKAAVLAAEGLKLAYDADTKAQCMYFAETCLSNPDVDVNTIINSVHGSETLLDRAQRDKNSSLVDRLRKRGASTYAEVKQKGDVASTSIDDLLASESFGHKIACAEERRLQQAVEKERLTRAAAKEDRERKSLYTDLNIHYPHVLYQRPPRRETA